ncbi:MAG: hypothetical protein KDA60_07120, partial [Planctomycetales bacterium]|nr:hypothetical protein [Planctomycetales bacterium]
LVPRPASGRHALATREECAVSHGVPDRRGFGARNGTHGQPAGVRIGPTRSIAAALRIPLCVLGASAFPNGTTLD